MPSPSPANIQITAMVNCWLIPFSGAALRHGLLPQLIRWQKMQVGGQRIPTTRAEGTTVILHIRFFLR
jgi:hypothetical protein